VLRKNRKVELLANVPLFAGLSKRELGDIAGVADELDLKAGKMLMREGQRGREFFVLESGGVQVERKGRVVRQLGPGEWVGEIALIADIPRTATVTTLEDTRVLVLTDRAFSKLIRDVPTIAQKMLRSVGERLAADET
jgi:CRP/FNR family transcriptional regulator, cyclic AMP receptor protein